MYFCGDYNLIPHENSAFGEKQGVGRGGDMWPTSAGICGTWS